MAIYNEDHERIDHDERDTFGDVIEIIVVVILAVLTVIAIVSNS